MTKENKVQPALETVADKLQQTIGEAFTAGGKPGKNLKNILNGVWLGHALHPALTDLPVGSWTVATVFDLISGAREDSPLAPGADAAISLGIIGSIGAALTGMTDWSDTYGEERRIGLIHMSLNVGALAAYCLSLALRRGGHRKTAVAISTIAYGGVAYSAYLGGEMINKHGTMVNHNAWAGGPTKWTAVLESSALMEDNKPVQAKSGDAPILLVRQEGKIHALSDVCSHAGGPLSEGKIEGDTVVCPWHGSRFCLKDGKVIDGPSTYDAPLYDVRERKGNIEVRLTIINH